MGLRHIHHEVKLRSTILTLHYPGVPFPGVPFPSVNWLTRFEEKKSDFDSSVMFSNQVLAIVSNFHDHFTSLCPYAV
jgi:hypothetical protein